MVWKKYVGSRVCVDGNVSKNLVRGSPWTCITVPGGRKWTIPYCLKMLSYLASSLLKSPPMSRYSGELAVRIFWLIINSVHCRTLSCSSLVFNYFGSFNVYFVNSNAFNSCNRPQNIIFEAVDELISDNFSGYCGKDSTWSVICGLEASSVGQRQVLSQVRLTQHNYISLDFILKCHLVTKAVNLWNL